VELITVSGEDSLYKQSPGHEEKGLNIHRVPNLLVYEGKTEMGRVVESPVISWEKDLLTILTKQEYSSRYKGVPFLVKLFADRSVDDINTKMEDISNDLRPLVFYPAELASYGKLLISSKEPEKAVIVFRLNSMLYPSPGSFNSLGDAYIYSGNKKAAIENYRRAVSLEKTP
jgi:tetratricopeptide (TPR) repeat protein